MANVLNRSSRTNLAVVGATEVNHCGNFRRIFNEYAYEYAYEYALAYPVEKSNLSLRIVRDAFLSAVVDPDLELKVAKGKSCTSVGTTVRNISLSCFLV